MKRTIIIILLLLGLCIFGIFVYTKNSTKEKSSTPTEERQEVVKEIIPIVDPMPNDKDRDGLTDEEEKALGTNERTVDTDSDFIPDGEEVKTYRTDPTKKDTDGDGFSDSTEILKGFNPNGVSSI